MKKEITYLIGFILIMQGIIIITHPTNVHSKNIDVDNKSPINKFDGEITTRFAGGDGSLENPFQVSNVIQLQDMNLDLSDHYILINDIDASNTSEWNSGKGFIPIAPDTDLERWGFNGAKFKGSLDGAGNNITGLHINRPNEYYLGLVGGLAKEGKITNVNLINCCVIGSRSIGGLAGVNEKGTISYCSSTGNVTGFGYIGGLVGVNNEGTISHCYAIGNVSGDDSHIGGLVGDNQGNIDNCETSGNVSGRSTIGDLWEGTIRGLWKTAIQPAIFSGNIVSLD